MLLALLACTTNAVPERMHPEISGPRPQPSVAYPDCAGSCSLSSRHQDSEELSEADFLAWLMQWSEEPVGEPTLALETLLFHGARSESLLARHGDRLDERHRAFLTQELSRTTVRMSMRLRDEGGVIRGSLETGSFSLRDKQHRVFEGTGSLGWLETGGKIKRVGLAHLWSRW